MTRPAAPAGIRQLVERLAKQYGGVEYDSHDRNRPAIEAACAELGVPAYPSETVRPRTIRGRTPDGDTEVDQAAAVKALTDALKRAARGGKVSPARVLQELSAAGWQLSPLGHR